MMKRGLVLLLCVLLVTPACAAHRGPRVQTTAAGMPAADPQPRGGRSAADRAVLAEFARQLPVGTRVKARVAGNRTIRGTLLKVTDESIFVQPRTRIAERLEQVSFDELIALEQDQPSGSNPARTAAIAASAAAAATLGTILILAAIFSD